MKISDKKNKYNILLFICLISLLISAVGIAVSNQMFMLAYHSNDIAWNMKNLEKEYPLHTFKETTLDGDIMTAYEVYSLGIKQNTAAFTLGCFSCFAFGFYLMGLIGIMEDGRRDKY